MAQLIPSISGSTQHVSTHCSTNSQWFVPTRILHHHYQHSYFWTYPNHYLRWRIPPSFFQTLISSPASTTSRFSWVSNLPPIPLPVNLTHQEELFKWLQDLPIQGYPTSTTNPNEQPKVQLPKTEPISMYKLHNMLNNPDQQHIFINAINLMGNDYDLLSCWWHFDHCINMAIRLEVEAET